MLKIVIDTNIWISYFISKKTLELTELILDNDLEVLTSEILVKELNEVLNRPKFSKYLISPAHEYLQIHLQLSVLKDVEPFFLDSPDPKDNFLFDLAIQEHAFYLITGDKKLFEMQEIKGLKIISLSEFKDLLKQ